MLARAVTHALVGLEPRRVEVEAHLEGGLPAFAIVGLADRACQEAKQRVRSGIASARARVAAEGGSPSTSRPRSCARRDRGSTCRSRSRCSRRRGRFRSSGSREHAAVGELALDGRVRPVAARSPSPRERGAPGSSGCSAPPSLRARRRSPASSRAGAPPRRGGRLPPRRAAAAACRAAGRACAQPDRARPRGRARPGARAARARARRRRAATTCSSRARRAPGRRCSAGGLPGILPPLEPRRGARGDAHPLRRRAAAARSGRSITRRRSARRTTAPRRAAIVGGGSGPRPGEASLAHRGVLAPRRAAGVPAAGARGAAPAARGRRRQRRAGAGPALFPARFQLVGTMNLCPVRRARRPGGRVHLLAAAARRVPRQALARAARPVRPRRHRAAAAGESSWRRAVRRPSAPVRERVVGRACAARGAAPRGRRRPTSCSPRRRAAAALRPRPRAGRARGANGRGARRREAVLPEHVAEALSYRSPRSWRRERARPRGLRGASDAHLVGEPRSARFAAFTAAFDVRQTARAPARARHPLLGRSRRRVSAAAARDPRSAAGALPPRRAPMRALLARPAVAIVGARACSPYGRQVARTLGARARGGRARRRQRARARRRRRGASRRARGGRRSPSPCSAAASTATTRPRTASSRDGSRRAAWSSPSTRPASSRRRGASRRGTGSSPGSAAATVVVEARERSGALITADFALEEGREVFAVPGEITCALSAGTNALLRLGRDARSPAPATCSSASGSSRPSAAAPAVGPSGGRRARARPRRRGERRRARARDRPRRRRRSRAALAELELAGAVEPRRRPGDVSCRRASIAAWRLRTGSTRSPPLRSCRARSRPRRRRDRRRRRHRLLLRADARAGGLRVRLHEAREVAVAARAAATAASRSAAARWPTTSRATGSAPSRPRAYWRLTEARSTGWRSSPATRSVATGSLRLAADDDERDELRAEFEALREDGFAAEWRRRAAGAARRPLRRRALPPDDGSLQPARWVRRLAAHAAEAGARSASTIASRTLDALEADDGRRRDRRLRQAASCGELEGVDLPDARPGARHRAAAERLFPMPALRAPRLRLLAADARRPARRSAASATRPRDRVHRRRGDDAADPGRARATSSELLGRRPAVTHRWAGIFGLVPDLLPLVGPRPGRDGVWVAGGYSGPRQRARLRVRRARRAGDPRRPASAARAARPGSFD